MFPDIDYTGTLPTLDPNSTLPELNFTLPAFTGTMPTELVTGTEPMTENGTETVTGTEATGTMETGTTGMRFQICPNFKRGRTLRLDNKTTLRHPIHLVPTMLVMSHFNS